MRVLLKQTQSGQFLKESDGWTLDSAKALDFKTAPAAMDYSRLHGHRGTCIILKLGEPHEDLELKNCW